MAPTNEKIHQRKNGSNAGLPGGPVGLVRGNVQNEGCHHPGRRRRTTPPPEGESQVLHPDIETAYAQCVDLIRERAWHFARLSGHGFEEMFSLGEYCFCLAYHKFNPNVGVKFSAWVYRVCTWSMMNYTKKYTSPNTQMDDEVFEGVQRVDPTLTAWTFREQLKSWSAEARYVVWLILDAPREVINLTTEGTPYQIRTGVKRHLRKIGYTADRVDRLFAHLREVWSTP